MSQMNSKLLMPAMIALMGLSAGAWADKPEPGEPDDGGEVTMRLMPPSEADLPDAVTKRIALPELVLENATANEKVKNAREALQKAEQRGTDGREHGWEHANSARENAQDMADNAKSNREARGRSDENRPQRPEPPDSPGDSPGRP